MNKTFQINNKTVSVWFGVDGRLGRGQNRILSFHGVRFCGRCQSVKELSKYHTVNGEPRPYCADCTKAAGREQIKRRYHKTKNGIKQKRFKFRNYLSQLVGGSCQLCGFDKFVTALEYHHVVKKDFDVSDQVLSVITTTGETRFAHAKKLSEEISKCVLICANCHCAIHGKQIAIDEKRMKNELISISAQKIVILADWVNANLHDSILYDRIIECKD